MISLCAEHVGRPSEHEFPGAGVVIQYTLDCQRKPFGPLCLVGSGLDKFTIEMSDMKEDLRKDMSDMKDNLREETKSLGTRLARVEGKF